MITTLLYKVHNVTGLRYFCKTVSEGIALDQYKGSGTLWKRHIKVHGNDVTTEIIAQFPDITGWEEAIAPFALKYSRDNDIVADKSWANLIEENGLDGAPPGHKHTDETKAKISAANKGKQNSLGYKHSTETRAKQSESKKGRKRSDETKSKMSASMKGKKHTDETRAKISAANKGRKRSDETRAKISAANKGRDVSDGTKAKMSAANKGRPSPMKGKKRSDETKAKMSAAQKGKKLGPRKKKSKT